MKHKFKSIIALLLLSVSAFSETANQESFKSSLIEAIKKNDTSIMMSITCKEGVTPDWEKIIVAGYNNLLPILQKNGNPTIEFTAFSGPTPDPIKYQDKMLVPNIPVTIICTVTFANDPDKASKTEFRLGEKNGTLLISGLVPK